MSSKSKSSFKTYEERLQEGRTARKRLSRGQLGELKPRTRTFDPIDVLRRVANDHIPALLPMKYLRMSASPFAFFRGAAPVMAADLARQSHTGIFAQLCGDAHVQNLGSFEAPDGRLVFDINDFDESIAGPWEWDVKRMAASIVLAGFEADHGKAGCCSAVEAFGRAYCETVEKLADLPLLTAARFLIHRMQKAEPISAALREAERAQPLDLLEKYTEDGARGPRFKKVEHVLWRIQGPQRHEVLRGLSEYRNSLQPERLHLFDFFRPIDVAFKIVGTGSVGLRDYVVLMEGGGTRDPLFLQVKQEVASAYAPYLRVTYAHQGQRVAEAQRKLQPVSDLLLGWTRIGKHHFLVRQLNDHKGSVDLDRLKGNGLTSLAIIAGELLARGHARSGDAVAIKGYIGNGDTVQEGIVKYALEYAALTQSDFGLFKKAIKDKRLRTAA